LEYDQLENGRRTKFIAIELSDLQEIIDRVEGKSKQAVKQETEIQTKKSTADITQTEPVKREEWEKQMLKLAFVSLKNNPANVGEEIQTATFEDGKYRVIYHAPSEMVRITDEVNNRGTLYKVQREKPIQICEFTEDEKKNFEQKQHKLIKQIKPNHPQGLQQD
jgi:hypothetical protein